MIPTISGGADSPVACLCLLSTMKAIPLRNNADPIPNNCLVDILAVFPMEPSIVFTTASVAASVSCWSLSLSVFDMKPRPSASNGFGRDNSQVQLDNNNVGYET